MSDHLTVYDVWVDFGVNSAAFVASCPKGKLGSGETTDRMLFIFDVPYRNLSGTADAATLHLKSTQALDNIASETPVDYGTTIDLTPQRADMDAILKIASGLITSETGKSKRKPRKQSVASSCMFTKIGFDRIDQYIMDAIESYSQEDEVRSRATKLRLLHVGESEIQCGNGEEPRTPMEAKHSQAEQMLTEQGESPSTRISPMLSPSSSSAPSVRGIVAPDFENVESALRETRDEVKNEGIFPESQEVIPPTPTRAVSPVEKVVGEEQSAVWQSEQVLMEGECDPAPKHVAKPLVEDQLADEVSVVPPRPSKKATKSKARVIANADSEDDQPLLKPPRKRKAPTSKLSNFKKTQQVTKAAIAKRALAVAAEEAARYEPPSRKPRVALETLTAFAEFTPAHKATTRSRNLEAVPPLTPHHERSGRYSLRAKSTGLIHEKEIKARNVRQALAFEDETREETSEVARPSTTHSLSSATRTGDVPIEGEMKQFGEQIRHIIARAERLRHKSFADAIAETQREIKTTMVTVLEELQASSAERDREIDERFELIRSEFEAWFGNFKTAVENCQEEQRALDQSLTDLLARVKEGVRTDKTWHQNENSYVEVLEEVANVVTAALTEFKNSAIKSYKRENHQNVARILQELHLREHIFA